MDVNTKAPIVLIAHHCKNSVTFPVKFYGDEAETIAIEYVQARTKTHAIWEDEDAPITDDFMGLRDVLYPVCAHGLSLHLCAGPGHYAPDRY